MRIPGTDGGVSYSGEVGALSPKIELIYEADCPNVALARRRLRAALTDLGVKPRWVEWKRTSPDAPGYARRYGSPTVLIEGSDVDHAAEAGIGETCRLYVGDDGKLGTAPSVEAIKLALRLSCGRRRPNGEAEDD